MNGLNYVDLVVEGEDAKHVLGRLIHWVHGFNGKAPRRVALAFPDFREEVKAESGRTLSLPQAGARLRLFGDEGSLAGFLASPPLVRMEMLGGVKVWPVSLVPASAGAERFSRDRSLQKMYRGNAYERRMRARAEAQGREFHAKVRAVQPTVRLEATSASTSGGRASGENGGVGAGAEQGAAEARSFLLDIRRGEARPGDAWMANVNVYGLSGEGSSTPRF